VFDVVVDFLRLAPNFSLNEPIIGELSLISPLDEDDEELEDEDDEDDDDDEEDDVDMGEFEDWDEL
jgi:hypothetical protein